MTRDIRVRHPAPGGLPPLLCVRTAGETGTLLTSQLGSCDLTSVHTQPSPLTHQRQDLTHFSVTKQSQDKTKTTSPRAVSAWGPWTSQAIGVAALGTDLCTVGQSAAPWPHQEMPVAPHTTTGVSPIPKCLPAGMGCGTSQRLIFRPSVMSGPQATNRNLGLLPLPHQAVLTREQSLWVTRRQGH